MSDRAPLPCSPNDLTFFEQASRLGRQAALEFSALRDRCGFALTDVAAEFGESLDAVFRWEKGEVKPTTPHIGRFFVETKHSGTTNNSVCYFDAPSLKPTESEAVLWLNPGETLLFQPASVLPAL